MFGLISKLCNNISFSRKTSISKEVFTIRPYRGNGYWLVTDESRQLLDDPIGIEVFEAIDNFAEIIRSEKFTLRFASVPISQNSVKLVWSYDRSGGEFYLNEHGDELWFSPAIFRYLGGVPKNLYLEASSESSAAGMVINSTKEQDCEDPSHDRA